MGSLLSYTAHAERSFGKGSKVNKSKRYEYRIMYRSDDTWPYYIQFRRLRFFRWWTDVTTDYFPPKTKTFYGLEDAKAHVEKLIEEDNTPYPEVIKTQVWPEKDTYNY